MPNLDRLWRALRSEVDAVETDVEAFNKLLLSAKIEGVVGKKKLGAIL